MTTTIRSAILQHLLDKHGVRHCGGTSHTMVTVCNYRSVCAVRFEADHLVIHVGSETCLDYNDPGMVDALDELIVYAVKLSLIRMG